MEPDFVDAAFAIGPALLKLFLGAESTVHSLLPDGIVDSMRRNDQLIEVGASESCASWRLCRNVNGVERFAAFWFVDVDFATAPDLQLHLDDLKKQVLAYPLKTAK